MKKVTGSLQHGIFVTRLEVNASQLTALAVDAALQRYVKMLEVRRDAGEIAQATVDIQAYQAERFVTWMLNEK